MNQAKNKKSGLSFTSLRFTDKNYKAIVYNSKNKDLQILLSEKDKGYIAFQKEWRF